MATPHVTGLAAMYKQTYGNAASSTIVSNLISWTTKNIVTGNFVNTPNRLLYKGGL